MTENINKKVIGIFDLHHKKAQPTSEEERIHKSPDGFEYIIIKSDENGYPLNAEKLQEKSDKQLYIVRVLQNGIGTTIIKNYKLPGERLIEFISSFTSEKQQGEIIDIDKYYPEELA